MVPGPERELGRCPLAPTPGREKSKNKGGR